MTTMTKTTRGSSASPSPRRIGRGSDRGRTGRRRNGQPEQYRCDRSLCRGRSASRPGRSYPGGGVAYACGRMAGGHERAPSLVEDRTLDGNDAPGGGGRTDGPNRPEGERDV